MVSGSPRLMTGSGIGELSELQRRRAMECYRLLRPHLDGNASLTSVAEEVKLSLRTLQRGRFPTVVSPAAISGQMRAVV